MIIGVGFAIVGILVVDACSDDSSSLPPLPEAGDGTGDVGEEEGAPDATDVVEAADADGDTTPDVINEDGDTTVDVDPDADTDADMYADADGDTLPDGVDVEEDVTDVYETEASDVDGDGVVDGEEVSDGDVSDSEVSTTDYYSCNVTVSDSYGMSYVASVVSSEPVTYYYGGWSGSMWFDGSPADKVDERRNDAAYTWPQSGQAIPLYAQYLTASYSAQLTFETSGAATFGLLSYSVGGATLMPLTIFPMTWDDGSGLAEPIEADTSNEIYVVANPPLGISVSSTDGFATFSGEALYVDPEWTITDPPDYLSWVGVECQRL